MSDYLVKLASRVSEDIKGGPVTWDQEPHYGDRISVKLALVTNTPDDEIGVATLHISVMGDGTFLISRTAIGSWSAFVASGNLLSTEGMGNQADAHVRMHAALAGSREQAQGEGA